MNKPFYVAWDMGCRASFKTIESARKAILQTNPKDFRQGRARIYDRRKSHRNPIETVEA